MNKAYHPTEVISISGKRTTGLILLVLLLAVLAVFWNVPRAEFVQWDDDINIYRNPYHGGLAWERISWMFTDTRYVLYYAPLSWLALSVIYEFSGLDPLGYHLASLALHCVNSMLVYFVIRNFLALRYGRTTSIKELAIPICAGLGTLLWAIHPLRVEAVAWATGLSHLLADLFAFVSLLCYLRLQSIEKSGTRRKLLLASILAFLASMLCYPIMLAFPLALVIVDALVLRRFSELPGGLFRRASRSIWLEKVPFGLISAAVLAFTLYRRFLAARDWAPISVEQFGITARVMQAFYVWTYYLWKPFVPFSLAPTYSSLLSVSATQFRFAASFFAVAVVTLFLVLRWRRFPGLLALWLIHLALLVPVLGFTEHPHFTTDRYSYGVAVLISISISAILLSVWEHERFRVAALTLVGIAALICGTLGLKQTLVWKDSVTLFRHVLQTLGNHPYRGDIHWRLGIVLRENGRLDEAERELREATRIGPRVAMPHGELGTVFLMKNQLDEAVKEFDAAIALNPKFAEAHARKAAAFAKQGKVTEAIESYEAALRINPNLHEALNPLAWIRATDPQAVFRNGNEAVGLALRACQVTAFDDPRAIIILAAAYAETGDFDQAIRTAEQAARLAEARGSRPLQQLAQQVASSARNRLPFRKSNDVGPKPPAETY